MIAVRPLVAPFFALHSFILAATCSLAQQPATWTGPAMGDWIDSGGGAWSSGVVPNSAAADVRIDNNVGQNSALTIQASLPNNGLTITVGRLTIDGGDSVTFGSNKRLTVVPGGFAGAGALTVNGSLNFAHGATSLNWGSAATPGPVTIQGSGSIQLGGAGFGGYLGDVVNSGGFFGTSPLVNQTTLAGTFDIGAYNSHSPIIQNSSLLHSNISGQRSSFHVSGATTNTGTIKASNGAILQLGQGDWDNTGGTILADGASSIVEHRYGRITGGTITTANGGEIRPIAGSEWRDLLTSGTTRMMGVLALGGTVTNTGSINVTDGRQLDISSGNSAVTVAGAGEIVLNAAVDGSPELINQGNSSLPSVTWTFQNQTVRGRGDVGYVNSGGSIDNVQILNRGTFQADVDGQMLRIDVANFDNQSGGVLRATGSGNNALGGILRLAFNGPLKNTGGTIEALYGGRIEATAARIEGGLIRNGRPDAVPPVPGGSIPLAGMAIVNPSLPHASLPFRDSDPNGMLLQGDIAVGNIGYTTSSVPRLVGEIKNTGKLRLAATGGDTSYLFLSETAKKYVAFTGGGEVILGTMPDGNLGNDNAFLIESVDGGFSTRTLANVDNLIHGFGRIGRDPNYGYFLNIENAATITADVSGRTLNVEFNAGTNNGGFYRAQNGGTLSMRTTNLDNTGGVLEALNTSPFKFVSAAISNGTLRNVGAAVNATNFDLAGATLTNVTLQGPMVERDAGTTTLVGTIQNEGSLRVRSAGSRTRLAIGSASVTAVSLNGPGEVILGDPALGSSNAYLEASQTSSNPTLTLNQNLRGFGVLGFNYYTDRGMFLVNNAEINADVDGKGLALVPHSIVNSPGKTMKATNGGNLYLHPVQLTNTNATISATGAGSKVTFDTQTIVDGGAVQSGAGSTVEVLKNLAARNGVVFTNAGTLLLGTGNTSNTFEGLANGGSSLINSGTIQKSGGGDYSLRTAVNSTGAVAVDSGVLRFFGGGTFANLSSTSATDLTFQGSPGYTFTGANTLGGSGRNWFADGVVITLPGAADEINAANLNFENTTLTGPGRLTHSGEVRFTYASVNVISGSRLETLAGATAKIQAAYYNPVQFTNGAMWDNRGTILFDNPGWRPPVVGAAGTKLTNHVGGVIWQDDSERGDLDMELENRGLLKVTQGLLNLAKNSAWFGGTANLPTGSLWNGGVMTLNGTTNAITGADWLYMYGGSSLSFTPGSKLTAERITFYDSSSISGAGELIVSKAAEWRPANGVAHVINATPVQLLAGSANRLETFGTLRLQNGAIIKNEGTFDMRSAFRLELNSGAVFENVGTMTATSGSNNPTFGGDGTGLFRTLTDSTATFFPSNGNSYTISLPFDFAGTLKADSGMNLTFDQGGLFNETAKIWANHPASSVSFTGTGKTYRSRGRNVEFPGTGYINFMGTTLQFEPSTIPTNESRIDAGARVAFHGNNTIKSLPGMQGTLNTTGFVFQNGTQTVDNATLQTSGTANDSVWNATGQKLQLKNGAKFVNGGRFVIAFQVGSGLLNDPGITTDGSATLFHNTSTGRLVHDSNTVTEFGVDFLNEGFLEFRAGTVNFRGDFRGRGGIAASNGAKVSLSLVGVPENQQPLALEMNGTGSQIDLAMSAGQTLAASISVNGGKLVAAGGLNLVAAGGLNLVAAGAGNLVAAGGMNLVAAGAGNITATGAGSIISGNQFTITPGGGIISQNGGVLVAAGGLNNNGGNLTADAGRVEVNGTAGITNTTGAGILSHNGGTLVNAGGLNNDGNVTANGGRVEINGAAGITNATGAGIISQNGGVLVNAGGLNNEGNVTASNGRIEVNGAAGITTSNGGQILSHNGGVLVAAGAGNILSHNGGVLVAAGAGNIRAEGGGSLVAAGGGHLVAAGAGNLVAAGGLNIAGKTKTTSAGGGQIRAENGGHLWGSGTFTGPGVVQSGGLLHPGSAQDMTPSAGALTWTGDLNIQNGGILEIELGGTTAGTAHDKITVSGALVMDGVLRVKFLNNFHTSIQATDTFTVASAGSAITGTIDNLTSGRVNTADGRGSFAVSFANAGKDLVLTGFQSQPMTLTSWLAQNNLTGEDALPTADVDFDGLNNLLEYALGRDPRAADGALGTTDVADVGGTLYLSWTYTRPAGSEARTDIIYTGERSLSVSGSSWDFSTVIQDSVVPVPSSPFETVRIRSTVPMTQPGNSPEFLRLKVTQSP